MARTILTLEEMGAKGKTKMDKKAVKMTENYDAAKSDMKKNYTNQPFGPLRTKHYLDAIDVAKHKTDSDSWESNWKEAMKK